MPRVIGWFVGWQWMLMSPGITQTWAPLMTIYRDAFITDNLPAAAASSTVLALGTVLVSVIELRIANRKTMEAVR